MVNENLQTYQKLDNLDLKSTFLEQYDNFLLDCDGDKLIPNISQTIANLRSLNKKLYFLSNNSTKTVKQYVDKFAKLGITVSDTEIFSSSTSTAVYLKEVAKFPEDKKVLVIGREGITDALTRQNIQSITIDDTKNVETDADLLDIQVDPTVGAVVMGMDRSITYYKLALAHKHLLNPDVLFVATNMDSTYPTPNSTFPGTGAILAPVICSTQRQPIVCGKPSLTGLDAIMKKYNLDLKRTCMVGDRLDTDIKFGNSGGLATLLVLTGVTKLEVLNQVKDEVFIPKYVIDGFANLFQWN